MKREMSLVAFCLMALSPVAGAHEYPLQFTPNPGYRDLVVTGYQFVGNTVVGNCSYYTVSGGSGRGGGHGQIAKSYPQTCTWDLYGKLLSVAPGAPPVPAPLSIKGSQAVYAVNGNGGYTGTDTKLPGRGFVSTPGPHYTWLTANNDTVVQEMVSTHDATLKSDGDVPVNISTVEVSGVKGTTSVKSTTCIGHIEVGATCVISVAYDSSQLTSPSGSARDTIRIKLQSDSGEGKEFIQSYTLIIPRKSEE